MKKKESIHLWMFVGLLAFTTSVFGEEAADKEAANKDASPREITAKIYGFIKGDYHYANGALLTFGHENLTAPTSAKRRTQFDDSESRSQVNFHNTRFGVQVGDGDRISGKVEMDFQGGFGKSQANTSTGVVRLRQALVKYKATDSLEFFGGQMWDIFSPQVPLANYSYVAGQLGVGNVGMMTERVGVSYDLGANMNLKLALGNTNANSLDEPVINHELDDRPVYAALLTMKPSDSITIYLSGIHADIVRQHNYVEQNTRAGDPLLWDPRAYQTVLEDVRIAWDTGTAMPASVTDGYPVVINPDGGRKIRKSSSGVSLGADINITNSLNLAFEAYYGKNLGDIRTIANSKAQKRTHADKIQDTAVGRVDAATAPIQVRRFLYLPLTSYDNIEEAGGWLAAKFKINSGMSIGAFTGISQILNSDDLASPHASSGSYTSMEALTKSIGFDLDSASTMGNMAENVTYGANFGFHPHPKLTFYIQVQTFKTTYHDGDRITKWRYVRSIDATTGAITMVDHTDYVDDMQIPDKTARATDITVGTILKF